VVLDDVDMVSNIAGSDMDSVMVEKVVGVMTGTAWRQTGMGMVMVV
jgi:hypothetical protein